MEVMTTTASSRFSHFLRYFLGPNPTIFTTISTQKQKANATCPICKTAENLKYWLVDFHNLPTALDLEC